MTSNQQYNFSISHQTLFKISTFLAVLSVFLIILIAAHHGSINLDYKPYNGAFQTFNPLRRIFAGELPGRDFNPYLGLGPTYLNAIFTFFCGRDFAASQFSTTFLAFSLHFIALVTIFFILGCRWQNALIGAAIIIITISFDINHYLPIWEIASPGNSNLSIRSALPFITTLVALFLFKKYHQKPRLFHELMGVLLGIQPLWSNDYGIPSFIALSTVTLINILKQQTTKINSIFLVCFSAIISFVVVAYCLTGGALLKWLQDNFGGVTSDQFWYYQWYNGINKIFSLQDLLSHPFLYIYIITFLIGLIYVVFYNYTVKYLLLLYIAATVFGAGLLSSLGGTISWRYYLQSIIVFTLTVLFIITHYLNKQLFQYWNKTQLIRFKKKCMFGLIVLFSIAPIANKINYNLSFPNPLNNSQFFWVEELGGWLPNYWQGSMNKGRAIKQELTEISSETRILSTYSSSLDVVANAFNPTGIDYIIHALGSHARKDYLKQFQGTKPAYITTLREDKTKWETWNRRLNWWFYREFYQDYQLTEATFYNLIWQRQEQPQVIDYPDANCKINAVSSHQVNLIVITESEPNDDKIYYVELALSYDLNVQSNGIPIIGKRGLVNATEQPLELGWGIGQPFNYHYGLPPSHNRWFVPIEHRLGTTSILRLNSYPEIRSQLIVKSCQAKIVAPITDFIVQRSTVPANTNNNLWQNGISTTAAGFLLDDPQLQEKLYPGTMVEFAASGQRHILKVEGLQVWVSGEKLNPVEDGYPNVVQVNLR